MATALDTSHLMLAKTVLHVIPSLRGGGAEHMLARLVAAARKQGSSPIVVQLGGSSELADTIRAADVPVHQLGLESPLGLPIAILRLARMMRQLRPIAVQGWLYYGDLLSLWALERSGLRSTTRLYWGVRNSDMDLRRYRPALRWSITACAKRSGRPDAVVANSYSGRAAHVRLGYAPKAFPVIPNGIDTARFRPDPALRATMRAQLGIPGGQPTVIHAARTDPMKDHDSFLKLAGLCPDVCFLLAGEGTEALAVPPSVIKLGYRSDLATLFAASDFALSTSAFGEGFPNVVAEAMAAGVPVVATDVGDARRIIDRLGEIVPVRDVAAMSAALRRLMSEAPLEHQQRAIACRSRIESRYSLDRVVAAFQALHLEGRLPAESGDEPADPSP